MTSKRAYIGFRTRHTGGAYAGRTIEAIMVEEPTAEANPRFAALWGPFSSLQAAIWIALRCRGNPHMQTVAEAERIYRDRIDGDYRRG